jgi:hypothetical protein
MVPIKEFVHENRHVIMHDLAHGMGILSGSCQSIVAEVLYIWWIAVKFMHCPLTHGQSRIIYVAKLLRKLQSDPQFLFKVITASQVMKLRLAMKGRRFDYLSWLKKNFRLWFLCSECRIFAGAPNNGAVTGLSLSGHKDNTLNRIALSIG